MSNGHYAPLKDWAKAFDPEYDADIDAAPGPYIASHCYLVNPHSAVMALLNVSSREEKRERYDEVLLWVLTLPPGIKAYDMETLWESHKPKRDLRKLALESLSQLGQAVGNDVSVELSKKS